MKKLIYFLVPTIVFVLLVAQVDDKLSEEAAGLVNRVDTTGESESYLFLQGIFSQDGESPVSVGRNILEEHQKLDADESYHVSEYPDSKKLPLPAGDEFCAALEDGCLEHLFSANFSVENLLRENSLLVSRLDKFLDFDEYKTLSKPTMHELFPPYQYISAAERIKVLEAISVYRNGGARKAIDSLWQQFSDLRKSMELQDSFVGKLIFLMKLSEIIDVMSVILSSENIKFEMIPGLSQSEKSFYMIAAREFGMSYHAFKKLDKHSEFLEMGGNFPGWVMRIVYKPNMTINAAAPMYYELERLAQLSPSDFARHIKTGGGITPSTSKLRNYIGSTLLEILFEYDEYVARFCDFDAKLALFNQVHHLNLKFGDMKNPFYGEEAPKEINGSLCFSGPLEDKRSLRCLRVKI